MPVFDPLKSFSIDPFKYLSNSYTPPDPFASVNKQLRAVGLDPLSIDAPARQTVGVPSTHTALDDLAPDQLAEAKEKAGGGLLSGLAWVGRKLDNLTGTRAIRGVLGGNWREALSAFNPISDELGLTDPKDIIYGRELLEKGGILGENKPGLDWGDVAGFGADVLLDPSTYFFGLGLATKGAKAATLAGKHLNKVGKLDDVLHLASTSKGAQALGLPEKMGARQAGMNLTWRKVLAAEAKGGLDDILGMPGLRHSKGLMGELADAGIDIAKVIDQPLTSSMHVGLPNFLANVGFKKLRPLKWLRTRPMNIKPGGRVESWAKLMDKLGSSARWSRPGRELARLFNPMMRRTQAGTRVPVTKAAQQARLKEYRFMERTTQQIHRAQYEFGQKWVGMPHFNAEKMLKDTGVYRKINSLDDAERMVRKNYDEMTAHMEGYHMMGDGTMRLPDWNTSVVAQLEANYNKMATRHGNELSRLEKLRFTADPQMLLATDKARRLTRELQNLVVVRNSDAKIISDVVRTGVKDQKAIGIAVKRTEQAHFVDAGLQIKGGERAGIKGAVIADRWQYRGRAKLSPHLKELEGDLDIIAQKYADALDYAQKRGVDITTLKDNYALFTPRMMFRVPETTPRGVQSAAAMGRSYANYGTKHQMARAATMTEWFGGTAFINRLSRKKGFAGAIEAGMTSKDTKDIVDGLAKQILNGEIKTMMAAGGDDAIRSYQALGILDDAGDFVKNAHLNPHIQELATFLANLDGRITGLAASAFEMNPAIAMSAYYVDIVRAGHATEIATSLIGEHAKFGVKFAAIGLKGSDETVDAMLSGWGRTDRGAQPILKIRTMRELRQLNDDWNEIYDFIGSNKDLSFLKQHIDEIVDGPFDAVAARWAKVNSASQPVKEAKLLSQQMSKVFQQLRLPNDLAADATRYVKAFTDPSSMNEWVLAFDRMTDLLKSSFTTPWPAFHFRNFLSGQVNNYFIGAYDPTRSGPMKYLRPVWDARTLLRGGTIKRIADQIPMFKGGRNIPAWAKADPDKYVSDWIRAQARAGDLVAPSQAREQLLALGEAAGYDPLQTRFMGEVPAATRLGAKVRGILGDKKLHFGKKFMGSARAVGYEVEGYNRLAPLIAFLKQGFSLDEAIKKVKLAQVDYTMLSDFEKNVMRRIIPFYTFTRRQIPFVIEQLANPSSAMSQAVKGISRVHGQMADPENPIPDWISSDFAIPLPGGAEGQQRYLTRAGGMLGGMEDVFSLLKPGRTAMGATRRTLSGIGSRMHPGLQAPVELATGQSLFLQRPLSETKPATARLIGGITGAEQVPSFPGPLTESIISRLPFFGRSVSTLRSLTDPRKPLTVDGQVSFLNLAARMMPSIMGLRISEVNMERIKNRIMQEAIEEHLKHNTSIKTFKHIYVPEAELANMDEESRALYLLYKQISSQAAKASRARKKEKSQAAAYSM